MPKVQTGVPEMLLTMGKISAMRVSLAFLLLPTCASPGKQRGEYVRHYDLMRLHAPRDGKRAWCYLRSDLPSESADARYSANGSGPHSQPAYYGELTTLPHGTNPIRVSCPSFP